MFATLVATALGVGPGERTYRLQVRGMPGARVALRAAADSGWLEVFCTSSVCAPHRVVVTISPSGSAIVKFDVFRVAASSPHRSRVTIAGDTPSLTLQVAIP